MGAAVLFLPRKPDFNHWLQENRCARNHLLVAFFSALW